MTVKLRLASASSKFLSLKVWNMILSEKSLNLFNSLAVYEFSKYSACFEVINAVKEPTRIEVFEVSPTPSGGILILAAANATDLELFYRVIFRALKNTLINSCLINNLKTEVVSSSLSQNSSEQIENLNFFETNSLCDAFLSCQKLAESGVSIVDFRVLRSIHNGSIIVYSGTALDEKSITIQNPSKTVRSYFQILK